MSSRSSLMLLSVKGTAQSYGVIPERWPRLQPYCSTQHRWFSAHVTLGRCRGLSGTLSAAASLQPDEGARREGNPRQGSRAGLHRAARLRYASVLLSRGAWRGDVL